MASFSKIPANNKQGYRWICTLNGLPDPVTGKRKQIARRGDTKKETEQRAQKVLDALMKGIDNRKIRKLTFEEVAWDWLKTYSKRKVKRSTVRVREKEIKVLLRYIAKVNIDKSHISSIKTPSMIWMIRDMQKPQLKAYMLQPI